MSWTAFHFADTARAGRTHIVGWDPHRRRWEVPCGLWLVSEMRPAVFDKPLCRTCARLTALADPIEVER